MAKEFSELAKKYKSIPKSDEKTRVCIYRRISNVKWIGVEFETPVLIVDPNGTAVSVKDDGIRGHSVARGSAVTS